MDTIVKNVSKAFWFEDEAGYKVLIEGFEDGFVTIEVPVEISRSDSNIAVSVRNAEKFIDFLYGGFGDNSNFKEQLLKVYGCNTDTDLFGIALRIQDITYVIPILNMSYYDVATSLVELIKRYILEEEKKIDKANREFTWLNEKLESVIRKREVAFESVKAKDEYEEKSSAVDVESWTYGEEFVIYVQYLVRKENYDIHSATEETYRMFQVLGNNIIDGLEAIKLISQFCMYGDEIYKAYYNIKMQRSNDALNYL